MFFSPQFSLLYIISFVVVTAGFVMFNVVPTSSASPENAAEEAADGTAESSLDLLQAEDTRGREAGVSVDVYD